MEAISIISFLVALALGLSGGLALGTAYREKSAALYLVGSFLLVTGMTAGLWLRALFGGS